MPTATVLDLITAALRKIGVHVAGQPVPPEEAQDAMDELNRLLETWSLQGRLVPRVSDLAFPLTPGQASYTVGVGGNFNTPRPVTLHDGYTRIGSEDYPYSVIPVELYAGIGNKSERSTWPEVLYYEPSYPLGLVHLWPVPSAATVLHLLSDAAVSQVSTVLDLLSLPPGYKDGLIYGLGKRLAPEYGRPLSPDFLADARQIDLWIQRHNTRPIIATVVMPGGQAVPDAGWIYHG